MLYLLETKLPESKSIVFALTNIYGVGEKTSVIICKKLGFSINLKVKDISSEQSLEILKIIEDLDLIINNDLRKLKSTTLKTLVSIKAYRGLRRLRGLPVRGQRTHTNAKSARKRNK